MPCLHNHMAMSQDSSCFKSSKSKIVENSKRQLLMKIAMSAIRRVVRKPLPKKEEEKV